MLRPLIKWEGEGGGGGSNIVNDNLSSQFISSDIYDREKN